MQLHGIHHLTAVSADARGNHGFYTRVLGMRLVKKTVNQDDVSRLPPVLCRWRGQPRHRPHLLRLAGAERERRGTHSIVRTALRVAGPGGARLVDGSASTRRACSTARCGRWTGGSSSTSRTPRASAWRWWTTAAPARPIPGTAARCRQAYQIRGLGPITISVPDLAPTDRFLTEVMAMRRARSYARRQTHPA